MIQKYDLFESSTQLLIQQTKEWVEIAIDWETVNKYKVLTPEKKEVGYIAERGGGFLFFIKRAFLRSHRPLQVDVFDTAGSVLFHMSRNFFFFFSDLDITDSTGTLLGRVKRRFGILYKKYDLLDQQGRLFATIKSPLWRLWTFPVFNLRGEHKATVSKKWGGALREVFTDADTFMVDYQRYPWQTEQKLVIFAAALSIDFDFFENNQGKDGGLLGG